MEKKQSFSSNKISTQPYKGARDFYPSDMATRNYIFNVWKKVCESFGFEEYDFPILEPFEIFSAKSGEELVNQQIFSFKDKAGRKLAIRPELTPGTVRMIAQRFKELQKPIKWFMIGNNWRFEKPQLGRGREFFQLEVNTFGVSGVLADLEIISIIVEIMKGFGADEKMFEVCISDRRLISALLNDVLGLNEETSNKTRKIMDKRQKLSKDGFSELLKEIGLEDNKIEIIEQFMDSNLDNLEKVLDINVLKENKGYETIKNLFSYLDNSGLLKYCRFDPSIIRGFDYSDGLVYEVFDKNPNNKRSMFGGERFDKLINIFGDFELPATGFAMGDITLLEFLKGWNLLPKMDSKTEFLVTVWPSDESKYLTASLKTANKLRSAGKNAEIWLETDSKLDKQLKYADKKQIPYCLILGEKELDSGTVTIKDMRANEQKTMSLNDLI